MALLCELSQQHVCLAIADTSAKTLQQLSYYELKNGLAPETVSDILKAENVDVTKIRRIILSNASREIVVVPASYFNEASARRFYTATYGNTINTFFYNDVTEHNVVVVHTLPQTVMNSLKSSYNIEVNHLYCCQLILNRNFADQIAVHFTSKEIYVIAIKEEQLKLVQTYLYSAPLDVVYYLLSICQQYGFGQTETAIILSGLISSDSAMYKEVYQYFSNVHFWKAPAKGSLQSDDPQHFFSSLYNLAACAL